MVETVQWLIVLQLRRDQHVIPAIEIDEDGSSSSNSSSRIGANRCISVSDRVYRWYMFSATLHSAEEIIISRSVFYHLRECGVVPRLVASACMFVCLCNALILESREIESSRFARRYIFGIFKISSCVKVMRSRSRSQEQKTGLWRSRVVCRRSKGNLVNECK